MVRTMSIRVIAVFVVSFLVSCANEAAPPRSSEPVAPETFKITCDGETTEVLTPTVQARSDGVHVLLTNTSDRELLYQSPLSGEGVVPGTTAIRLPILPGPSRFRCLLLTKDVDPGVDGGWASFEVLAPAGWVSPALDCPSGAYSGVADFVPGARGVADPLVDAREQFRLEGVVAEAGYRTESERTFINVTPDGAKRIPHLHG